MKKKVIVLNDELGTMALGFSKAGYDIDSIYIDSSDYINYRVCENNWGFIVKDILEIDNWGKELPIDIDCIAGKVRISMSIGKDRENEINPYMSILYAMQKTTPKCIMVLSSVRGLGNKQYTEFCEKLVNNGYYITCQNIEVGAVTGFPVEERLSILVAVLSDKNFEFDFLKNIDCSNYSWEKILEPKYIVADWYYKMGQRSLEKIEENAENSILCWNGRRYEKRERVTWNYVHVPLVNLDGKVRKMTHKEIARLKGIPDEYFLPIENKAILYRKIMSSINVHLIQYIASGLFPGEDYLRKREISKTLHFRNLFISFLNQKQLDNEFKELNLNKYINCLQYKRQGKIYNFTFKIYNNNVEVKNKLLPIFKKYSEQKIGKASEINILIIANTVAEKDKKLIKEKYNIIIWDIANILWALNDLPQLKSEFIALLSFNVSDIIPIKPDQFLEEQSAKIERIDLQERLRQIKPGKEEAVKYEEVCIDIVKFLFSDYIEFYTGQKKSNANMYRFDYCGKIKHGEVSEFFETVQRFFDTKYIIFEFKNYEEEITPKEIYSSEKYLYEKALRKVAIIISRKGSSENARKAARGSLRELGKLIVSLSDVDVNNLIDIKNNDGDPSDYLEMMLDDMLMDLEK